MPSMFLVRFPEAPVPVPEKGKVTIGRVNTNTIVLSEIRVSRFHALIEYQSSTKTYVISDLGSANGTYVNNQRIHALEMCPLANWDKIRIASNIFTVRFTSAPSLINREFNELHSRAHLQATEVAEFSDIKSAIRQSALSGDLEQLCAIDLFQMLEHGAKTGTLTLKTDIGEGTFTINKGKIISAEFGKARDENAVFESIRSNRGTFSFSPVADVTKESRITDSTTVLLMEGCRLLDEENSGAAPGKK
jgi:pSer/pThr/pTyr-binding forkhead associated (FHA) protein